MKKYKNIISFAKNFYKDEPSGHDFSHIKRVLSYSKKIQKIEGGNYDVIFISALLHDIHRVVSAKEGHYISPQESMQTVKNILYKFKNDIDPKLIELILYCIENHEDKNINTDVIELKILIDADILDGYGKIGLKRTKKYCKNFNIPLSSTIPLDTPEYIPDKNPISALHYVYRTMLNKCDLLKTNTAKKLANKNKKILLKFIKKNTFK